MGRSTSAHLLFDDDDDERIESGNKMRLNIERDEMVFEDGRELVKENAYK